MNDLEAYFLNNPGRQIDKWMHYFEVYDRHFTRFRDREVVILEIGVFQGGSLQMWKHYFGQKARIYGVDMDPRCKALEEHNVTILIGSQSDRRFLRSIKHMVPRIDILIDDGGHSMKQQRITFEELFDHIRDDGIYLCEDVHTSYWLRYGGGYRRKGSFVECCKGLIDRLNAWHSEEGSLVPDSFTRSVGSIHFYDSMIVIEKRQRERPLERKTGAPAIDIQPPPYMQPGNYRAKLHRAALLGINYALRLLRLPSYKL
jgi:hypothetical protein